ncbi:MAG: efflux RND transporter periplasmic adaptor subunit [Rubrivivax sp.]|nr:efflux RND transporter periplasmic adaptor subunit [Rubrivivax sp.]
MSGAGALAALVTLASVVIAASAASAAPLTPGGTAAGVAAPRPLGCLIEPDRVADVGSQLVGVVQQLHVERGDVVRAGQALVVMRADVELANLRVAQRRAAVNADVRAAEASLALARQKVVRAEALVAQGFVSEQASELARGEHELAAQKLNQVASQRDIWHQEHRVAEAQLALRTVRAPFAGVVVERFATAGERVEEKPLVRVAVINPLRVELMVPTAQYGRVKPGDRLSIQPELPGTAPVMATVSHVDRVLDAASNSFRVRLVLPNPQHRLPAGLRCRAELPTHVSAVAAGAAAAVAVVARPGAR